MSKEEETPIEITSDAANDHKVEMTLKEADEELGQSHIGAVLEIPNQLEDNRRNRFSVYYPCLPTPWNDSGKVVNTSASPCVVDCETYMFFITGVMTFLRNKIDPNIIEGAIYAIPERFMDGEEKDSKILTRPQPICSYKFCHRVVDDNPSVCSSCKCTIYCNDECRHRDWCDPPSFVHQQKCPFIQKALKIIADKNPHLAVKKE